MCYLLRTVMKDIVAIVGRRTKHTAVMENMGKLVQNLFALPCETHPLKCLYNLKILSIQGRYRRQGHTQEFMILFSGRSYRDPCIDKICFEIYLRVYVGVVIIFTLCSSGEHFVFSRRAIVVASLCTIPLYEV